MWLSIWLSVALGAPPESIDLSVVDKWNDGAEAMLNGANGCWELVGHAKWDWRFGRFGETRGEAVFAGRLEDGIWTDFHVEPLGELSRRRRQEERLVYSDERHFAPLVGKLPPRETQEQSRRSKEETSEEPRNVLRQTLEEIGSLVSTSWASWDEARSGVVYHTSVPIGEGSRAPEIEIKAYFPDGGDWATEQDIQFPPTFRLSRPLSPVVRDASVHLRSRIHQNQVFPSSESFRFGFQVLGFEMSGAQSIQYTHASRCRGW